MDFLNAIYFSFYPGPEDLFRFEPPSNHSAIALPSTVAPVVKNSTSPPPIVVHHIHTHTHFHTCSHSSRNMGAHYSQPHMHIEIANLQANNNQSNGTKSTLTHFKMSHHPSYWIQLALVCLGVAVGFYLFYVIAKYLNKKFGCCVCCMGPGGQSTTPAVATPNVNSMEMGYLPHRPPPPPPQPAFNPQQLVSSPLFQMAQAALPPGVSTGVGVAANALANATKANPPARAASVPAIDVSHAHQAAVQQAWGAMHGIQ